MNRIILTIITLGSIYSEGIGSPINEPGAGSLNLGFNALKEGQQNESLNEVAKIVQPAIRSAPPSQLSLAPNPNKPIAFSSPEVIDENGKVGEFVPIDQFF